MFRLIKELRPNQLPVFYTESSYNAEGSWKEISWTRSEDPGTAWKAYDSCTHTPRKIVMQVKP